MQNITANTKTVYRRASSTPAIERLEYGLPRSLEEEAMSELTVPPSALPPLRSVANGSFGAFGSAGFSQSGESECELAPVGAEVDWALMAAELEAQLSKERAEAGTSIATARDEGRREAQHAAEAAFNADRQRNQLRIAAALEAFRGERLQYFKDVEKEVVCLALAIATRVLHREAQMDPLFLSGAVRVALNNLADSSDVVLRVAPAQVPVWQETFRPGSGVQPEIVGDLSLPPGECVLETRLGTIEVGVRAQLEEIEKGFFDLLAQRPVSIANTVRRAV